MTASRPFIDWTVTPAGIIGLAICAIGAAAGLAVLAAVRAGRSTTAPAPPPAPGAYREGALYDEHVAQLRADLVRAAGEQASPATELDDEVTAACTRTLGEGLR